MLFYIAVFAVLVLMRFAMGEYAQSNRRFYFVILLFLFAMSAFRFEVGCDWFGYVAYYEDQKADSLGDALGNREWLWYVILEAMDQLGLDFAWINVITSATFFYGIHILAKRQPDPVGFLVLLFPILIINLPMSGIRQGMAVGIICIALTAFLDRRVVRFIILTAIAGSIHSSAILFFLLVPFCMKLKPKMQIATATLLAVPGLALILTSSAADVAMSRYVGTTMDAAGAGFRLALLFATAMVFIFLLRRAWPQAFPQDYQLMDLGALMMIAATALLILSSVIADRVGYYLVPIQAAMLARIPFLPVPARPLLFLAPYAALFAVFVVWMSLSSLFDQCYVPYQTWVF